MRQYQLRQFQLREYHQSQKEIVMVEPLNPGVIVQLSGKDGNAYAIIGAVRLAMRRANLPQQAIKTFTEEAMASDYDHVLQTAMATVTIE